MAHLSQILKLKLKVHFYTCIKSIKFVLARGQKLRMPRTSSACAERTQRSLSLGVWNRKVHLHIAKMRIGHATDSLLYTDCIFVLKSRCSNKKKLYLVFSPYHPSEEPNFLCNFQDPLKSQNKFVQRAKFGSRAVPCYTVFNIH